VIYQGKHMGGADAQIPPGEKGPMGVVDLDAGISDGLVKTNQIGIGSDHGAGHNFGGAEAGTGPESDIDTEEQMETVEAGWTNVGLDLWVVHTFAVGAGIGRG
jgi:hypothetical protein